MIDRDEVHGVAWEARQQVTQELPPNTFDLDLFHERFAAIVEARAIAKEREECAKVCDSRYMGDNNREDMEAKACAAAIRARGQQ